MRHVDLLCSTRNRTVFITGNGVNSRQLDMAVYIALGVGTGDFSSRRKRMEDYVRETNQRLTFEGTPTRVIDWYHSAGNFVVRTPKTNRFEIADELSLALGAPCKVLTVDEVTSCVSIADKANSPPAQAGIRWTKGIAFEVRGRPRTWDLKPTPRAEFFRINDFSVGVNKKDALTDGQVLDKDDRAGGWGAVSQDVSNAVGGIWTARSLVRIKGVLKKAREHMVRSN
jgi:hypothetical protein